MSDKEILDKLFVGFHDVPTTDNVDTLEELIAKCKLIVVGDTAACDIVRTCLNLADFLLYKNRNYGNSALEPLNVFSKVTASDQINNRMDDKLSRIKNSNIERKNDFVDLMGYLTLKCVANGWESFEDLKD